MNTLADLKAILAAAFLTDAVTVTLNNRVINFSAAELGAALGVKPADMSVPTDAEVQP